MKDMVLSFVELGKAGGAVKQLDFYKNKFERPFLSHTKEFYKQEAAEFLGNNSVSDYMKKVESRLSSEKERARR